MMEKASARGLLGALAGWGWEFCIRTALSSIPGLSLYADRAGEGRVRLHLRAYSSTHGAEKT